VTLYSKDQALAAGVLTVSALALAFSIFSTHAFEF